MTEVFAVIMAGGRGERFWPLSADSFPKPFLPLAGSATLIQETVSRLQPLISPEQILISVGAAHEEVAREQLPQIAAENFVIEPVGRDTAACLGFCALHLEKRAPGCVMLAMPADHFIAQPDDFRSSLQKGLDSLIGVIGIVFGIMPVRPDTGYGYILAEKPSAPADAWPVLRFVEKPNAETAAQYLMAGSYFWNSGMFLWKNQTLLDLFQKHMPEMYRRLCQMRPLIGVKETQAEALRIFSTLQRISIDFGILEKTDGLRMIPLRSGWDDIGSWNSLERIFPPDAEGNVTRGSSTLIGSNGCITYSDSGIITALGVKDMVIVQARGRVLVCPKSVAADLKKLVSGLKPEWK
jgi:mannose-1-phosphate guanylyltransferase